MSLLKEKLELKIDNEDFVMMFDMKSLAVLKSLGVINFSEEFSRLRDFDMGATVRFIASTLRKKESLDEPLGKDFIENGNLILALDELSLDVIKYVSLSLPEVERGKK